MTRDGHVKCVRGFDCGIAAKYLIVPLPQRIQL